MLYKCNLPKAITLPGGAILKPVIGGHLENKPFLTPEHSGVDVTQNGWGKALLDRSPERFEISEEKLVIAEAKRQGLKYRRVRVLSRNLRGKLDLHRHPYTGTRWIFVEVKP